MKQNEWYKNLQYGLGLASIYTLLLSFLFFSFIFSSTLLPMMDLGGWAFFVCSCISHAASVMLVLYLLAYAPLSAFLTRRTSSIVYMVLCSLVFVLVSLDKQVYALYRFHINGFVLDMVFGVGATEIFDFSPWLYVKEVSILLLYPLALLLTAIGWDRLTRKRVPKTLVWSMVAVMLSATLYAHLSHIYTSYKEQPSVLQSQRLLPYYFPTTAENLMIGMGVTPPDKISLVTSGASSDICYPAHPLTAPTPERQPNILFILIDAWNRRSLTEECMPNAYGLRECSQSFDNHFSGSNGTRSAIFSLFFSAPGYYIDMFGGQHLSPLFIDRMLQSRYHCQIYPGATLLSPPLNSMVFSHIPDLNVRTEGETSYERDIQLTNDFMQFIEQRSDTAQPFFAMLFYDLAHSIKLPQEENIYFTPAWRYADYTQLHNDIDPTEFFNLYLNCCHVVDREIGRVLTALRQRHLDENTIIVLTADHAQEFNENHHNYWGHNGNFSQWQIGVPLMVHYPSYFFDSLTSASGSVGCQPHHYTHRTTHYDIVPTLMQQALGVTNPIADYSIGTLLTDTATRPIEVVGSELNYAFILPGDTIVEKTAEGTMAVYDSRMNPVYDYHLSPAIFTKMMQQLNFFIRQEEKQ